ncbi:hypothetical protein Z949_3204 [Sulfitobacter guttiformis KCTC 32187]|uniref:Uncharacterized protein n=1 Tax=Sulfitobacter guttiformis TaxID=74349 RepID=A0A420DQW9_9RHOB|nr:hypothetical protein Z949_3204 [Sulfitobacter guttiformis KCTC 32187]RKE96632.1 hypothetical protein C8N30_1197 [Sulfitobacter guttiformis]
MRVLRPAKISVSSMLTKITAILPVQNYQPIMPCCLTDSIPAVKNRTM